MLSLMKNFSKRTYKRWNRRPFFFKSNYRNLKKKVFHMKPYKKRGVLSEGMDRSFLLNSC